MLRCGRCHTSVGAVDVVSAQLETCCVPRCENAAAYSDAPYWARNCDCNKYQLQVTSKEHAMWCP